MKSSNTLVIRLIVLSIFASVGVEAQRNTSNNSNGFKIHISYLKKFVVEDGRSSIRGFSNQIPNLSFNGDTATLSSYDKGYRLGLDYDLPLYKKSILKNFSITAGVWYQSTNSEIKFYSTSQVNSNGAFLSKQNTQFSSISSLFALNYHYFKLRFAFGGNIHLFLRNRVNKLYFDGFNEEFVERGIKEHSVFYCAMEFPFALKEKLFFRGFSSFRVHYYYGGIGLAYKI